MRTIALLTITRPLFLLLSVAAVRVSSDESESAYSSSTATADEGISETSLTESAEVANSEPPGTVFMIVSTPGNGTNAALGVDGVLLYANPRSTDTLLEHYRRVGVNSAQPGRQSCPAKESIWTARPRDALTVQTYAGGRVVCTEGELTYDNDFPEPPITFRFVTSGEVYAVGTVERVLSDKRSTAVVVAEGALLEKNVGDGAPSRSPRTALVVSKNALGKTNKGGNAVNRTPRIRSGDHVALICPQAGTPVVALQADYASPPDERIPLGTVHVDVHAAWPTTVDDGTEETQDNDTGTARVVVQPRVQSPAAFPSQRLLLTLQRRNGRTRDKFDSFFLDARARCLLSMLPSSEQNQRIANLHCYGARNASARRRRRKTSMTTLSTINIPEKVENGISRILNFLTYSTVISASGILAGHGLLAFDPTGREALLTKMTGVHYVGDEYHFLRYFISPTQIGEYFRAGSWSNLKMLGRHLRDRDFPQSALGFMISGIGVKAVNVIFPVFLLFLLAYLLNRPLLWPVQKIYTYYKKKKEESKAAAATDSSVELNSLCPRKRVIVKCAGFQERLQMMG